MPYAVNGETRIYWEEEGSGDPLLMIMGLGYSLRMWREMRSMMAARFRTIVFDNRGVGLSDSARGMFSMTTMARDAVAVLDASGVAEADVIGMSMGGMIAQELALRCPERVRRLVLGCTSCGALHGVHAHPKALELLITRAKRTEDRTEKILPWLYDPHTPRERIEQDLAVLRRSYPGSGIVLKQLAAITGWSSYGRLPSIRQTTLVMHGETDRLLPPANARILASRIPNAKLIMVPRAGHIFPTDQPEISIAAILEFLR